MPSGFEAVTDTGNIQVTQDYSNFVMIAKGSLNLGPAWTYVSTTGGPFGTITLPNTYGYPPLIVLACAQPIFLRDAVRDANGNWVYGLAGVYASAQGALVEWYAFGPPHDGLAREPFGLEVFRADGSTAFHSSWKPLRVVGQVNNSGSAQFNGIAGRKYAVAHVIDQFSQSAPIPAGTWRVNGSGTLHSVNGAQVVLANGQIYSTIWGTFPPFPTEYTQPRAQHLVIDVTNY